MSGATNSRISSRPGCSAPAVSIHQISDSQRLLALGRSRSGAAEISKRRETDTLATRTDGRRIFVAQTPPVSITLRSRAHREDVSMRYTDIAIIGGGLAGSTAA